MEKQEPLNLTVEQQTEVMNHLIEAFKKRMEAQYAAPYHKKYKDAQAHFFAGAYFALDYVSGRLNPDSIEKGTTMPPYVFFTIMRGDILHEKKEDKKL